MEQQTGSKLGKEYAKAVYCHPPYLIYMQRNVMQVRKQQLDADMEQLTTNWKRSMTRLYNVALLI